MYINTAALARKHLPLLGVIPILNPIESSEPVLDDKYVRQDVLGRLSSRHFRNQLRMLKAEGHLDEFLKWSGGSVN